MRNPKLRKRKKVKQQINSLFGRMWCPIAIIPQYIFLWRSRTDEALKKQVETLTQEIEMLKKQRIQNP